MTFPPHVETLLQKRYYFSGDNFKKYYGYEGFENWEMLCNRVAKVVSNSNPEMQKQYFDLLYHCDFLPNSPTLFGAGIPNLCLSACFVCPVEDSIEGWANAFRSGIEIQTAGGGIGFPLGKIRPAGFPISTRRAKAAGPIEFMKCWNQISKSFSQAVRKGANMGQLPVWHPSILEFIECKDHDGDLSAFNISVAVTEKFMEAVINQRPFDLTWDGKVIKTIDAEDLWNKICHHAWKTGEPGIIFHDQIQRNNKHPEYGELYVNPCLHEDTLILTKEYGVVTIKSLYDFFIKKKRFHTFDFNDDLQEITTVIYSGYKECIKITLQNQVEIICTPEHLFYTNPKWIKAQNLLGKTLFNSNSIYKSTSIVTKIEAIGKFNVYDFEQPNTHCGMLQHGYITHNCSEANLYENSACNLGSINLSNFITNNKFDYERFRKVINTAYEFLDNLIDVNHYPNKNIEETVKQFRQIGLGIMGLADVFIKLGFQYGDEISQTLTEKIFSVLQEQSEINNNSLQMKKGAYPFKQNNNLRNSMMNAIAPTGNLSQIAQCSSGIEPIYSFETTTLRFNGEDIELPNPYKNIAPYLQISANDLPLEQHLVILAIAQKYVDMSISKTINLQNKATVNDVKNAFIKCYHNNIKGITIFRDGSRENQVYSVKKEESKVVPEITPIKRPSILHGYTVKDKIGCGNLYTTINFDNDRNLIEVFIKPGKKGGCPSNVDALGRIISIALRSKIDPKELIEQLEGIKCFSCVLNKPKGVKFLSCADAVAHAIKYFLYSKESDSDKINKFYQCPECNQNTIVHEQGCQNCKHCGYSKCG